jgi:hypothetical protein
MSLRMRGDPSAEFERRSASYAGLDAQFRDRTRFFAAAALINTVLARLFGVLLPTASARHSLYFLEEVGASLETENIAYAREMVNRESGGALDHALVCAEQGKLQNHVWVHRVQRPRQWEVIRTQLNGLLNDRLVVSVSRWCHASDKVAQALWQARDQIGRTLDFETEAHRVRIGVTLIGHIRRGETLAHHGPHCGSTPRFGLVTQGPYWKPILRAGLRGAKRICPSG